jgi:hypothetical protein
MSGIIERHAATKILQSTKDHKTNLAVGTLVIVPENEPIPIGWELFTGDEYEMKKI